MYADLLPAEAEAWHLKCLGGQKMPSLEPLHPARGGDRVTLTLNPTPRKFYKPPDLDESALSALSMAHTINEGWHVMNISGCTNTGRVTDDRMACSRRTPYRCDHGSSS